jgi:alpha-glucosidase
MSLIPLMRPAWRAAAFALILFSSSDGAVVSSPNNRISVAVEVKENLEPYPAGRRLYYSVTFDGKPLVLDSGFRLDFKGAPPLARDLAVTAENRRAIDESWEASWGIRKQMRNRANELVLSLQESSAPRRQIRFVVRAYDDGVAFRYELPEQPALREFKLAAERSEFHFAGNPTVWAANYGGFVSHQEGEFKKMRLNDIRAGDVIGCPLLVQAGPHWVALTEADLSDWAGMYFTALPSSAGAVMTVLSPRPEEPDVAVISRAPRLSPWRTMLIGERPGDLIESNLIWNLNPPNALADTSWVRPGISAWDRWWPGSYAPDFPGKLGMSTASMKYFVDFAAEMGWRYQLVDWTWYGEPFDPRLPSGMAGNPKADLGKSIPELDIPELVRYAGSKSVKIWVWLEWSNAEKQMERVFPLYEKWGVAGVKVDFMQRDDQWMVNFYERLVKLAAKHHLMVDFHGSYKPTGMERTWPNLLTREGVLGNENNKWSANITATHKVTLPFTRMLCGPMDFTPGGFRQKTAKTFRVVGNEEPGPFVMGTRAQELAMLVVYFSPLQVMCDSPYNYRMSPGGLDFLRAVPTTWDETRVVDGFPGEFIVMARRSGNDWFIGGMNGDAARRVRIPLGFLGPGNFEAQVYADPDEAADYPDRVWKERVRVTAADQLTARMASGGGYVVRLVKQN